jgi:hypothetical protein
MGKECRLVFIPIRNRYIRWVDAQNQPQRVDEKIYCHCFQIKRDCLARTKVIGDYVSGPETRRFSPRSGFVDNGGWDD